MTDWTAADLPSFAGRTVIITGANSGLGAVTARELAAKGATIVMAVRNTSKGEAAARDMTGPKTGQVEVRQLDLQDLASVRRFADGVDKADVLINNAGIMAAPYALTVDGFESQIGTNHLGHFALTNADFGARQTLYAASQDLPGDTFVGPRFGYVGRTQPVGRSRRARDAANATALWELSEQLTGTKFRSDAPPSARVCAEGFESALRARKP
jgi:nucleoside-diphosphate-sugar epimerase